MLCTLQPDWSEERRVVMAAESLRAELRGTEAMAKLREETSRKMAEAQRINMARYYFCRHMSRDMRKSMSGFSTGPDTNWSMQSQTKVRSLKFWI